MRIETTQHKRCNSRLDENIESMQLKIDVTPSVKSKVKNESVQSSDDQLDDHYTIFTSFDICTKKCCIVRIIFLAVMTVVTNARISLDFCF